MDKKRNLIQWLGLFGMVSFLSYIVALVFSPLAYPGYNWMAQAVSDLSADNSPSRILWNQLSSLSGVGSVVCIMLVCIYIQGRLSKSIRIGIYLFAVMMWLSAVGYTMFPLTDSGFAGTFQDVMHYRSLGIWAAAALLLMIAGAIGINVMPSQYFGIPERFSVIAAMGFNAVLGVYLFRGFGGE